MPTSADHQADPKSPNPKRGGTNVGSARKKPKIDDSMTKLAGDLPATTQLAAVKLTLKGQQGLIMKINVGNSIWIANEGESEIILEEGALLSAIIGCVLGVCDGWGRER